MNAKTSLTSAFSSIIRLCAAFCLALGGLALHSPQPVHAATTWIVTETNGDYSTGICYSGSYCFLRDAVANAQNGDVITFKSSLAGQTISLSSELVLTKNIAIAGPGDSSVIISGRDVARIFNVGSTVTLSNLVLTNGYTTASGGEINNSGYLTLNNVTIQSSAARNINGIGGGIFNSGTLIINRSVFLNNTAQGSGGGGAIYISSGTVTITDSTFSGNSASQGGAIANWTPGNLTVTGSTFTANSGSAISSSGTLNITNSTFSGNTGGLTAGAIYSTGNLSVNFSTITGNTSTMGYSGGIRINSGTATVNNTILANNLYNNALTNCSGTFSGSNNLSDDGTCGTSSVSSNIRLGSLGNNGGSTQTIPILEGSDAIDRAVCGVVTADQRGISRPQGTACDIGAFEYIARWWVYLPMVIK